MTKRGSASVVAIVLLIMIMIIGALSVYFWLAGTTTKEPTTNKPLVILANPISNDYVTLRMLIANVNSEDIPAGTELMIAENGVTATLTTGIASGCQQLVEFVGYNDGTERYFPSGAYTVYGSRVAQSKVHTVVRILPETTSRLSVAPNANADYNPSVHELGGSFYLVWDSDRLFAPDYDILLAESPDGVVWDAPIRISNSQDNRNPDMAYDGVDYAIVWDMTNPVNEHVFNRISADAVAWAGKVQVENEANRNREPSLIVDSGGMHHVAWASQDAGNYDIYLKSSATFVFGGEPSVAVTLNPASDAFPSFMQDTSGTYWIAFESDRGGSDGVWLTSSNDALAWSAPVQVPTRPNAKEPSLMQDALGRYWLAYYADDGVNSYIWIHWSDDMVSWSPSSRVSPNGVIERSPFLVQASDGTFWVAFEGSVGGNYDIYVRSAENALYWAG